jgi:hypothetical protein
MSKSKKTDSTEALLIQETEQPAQPAPEMNSEAFSVIEKDGKFHLISIEFDSASLKTSCKANIIKSDKIQFEIEEQFKVFSSNRLFN